LDEFFSSAYLVYCVKYTCFAQVNVAHSTEYHRGHKGYGCIYISR